MPGFAASADACVSFDGTRVLFSGRQKPADVLHIWEIPVAGGTPRQITSGNDDDIAPFYLPADKVIFSRRTPAGAQIEIIPANGSLPPQQLTYGPGDHIATDVLRDGRILFTAPHAAGGTATADIYAVYPDGTGVQTFRCDHGHNRTGGRELLNGDIVFETSRKLGRFTSARAVELPIAAPKGNYAAGLLEIEAGDWIVSYRASAQEHCALYRLQLGTGALDKLVASATADAIRPVAVRPRTPPKWFPSSVGDRTGANVLCLNVYTSKLRIPDAIVAAVRVYALDNRSTPVALGEAPVERDGSFFLNVPTERAIRIELLDGAGRTVAGEKGWFWMRRGEQRVCVGCHAGPERAPENAVPQVLLRTTEPVKMELPK